MVIRDHIETFLPNYLQKGEKGKLLKLIDVFPQNLDSRFYTLMLKNEPVIFQGDGIADLPISNLPKQHVKFRNCIVTSNTCDIALGNKRLFSSRMVYAPILNLDRYLAFLHEKNISSNKIKDHKAAIMRQEITQIFYLPKSSEMEASIVFLDRINCSNDFIKRVELDSKRIFTLSNYGFYLFLLKLSMSFSRIAEEINRG